MKMYHKVLTVVCCATHTRLGVKVIDSSCSCAIPITDAALRTEFFLFASSSTIGGTYEETKIRNHSAIYRICGKAESFHLQLHLALILVSCFFFFSCFLLCFVFNWYMQMNVGVSPITVKLFEYNSVVQLCVLLHLRRRTFLNCKAWFETFLLRRCNKRQEDKEYKEGIFKQLESGQAYNHVKLHTAVKDTTEHKRRKEKTHGSRKKVNNLSKCSRPNSLALSAKYTMPAKSPWNTSRNQ